MTAPNPQSIEIETEADIVQARRIGRSLSRSMGFGTIVQSRIATSVSELARNIYLFAGRGTVSIEQLERDGRMGLRITAVDQGPGIGDIRQAMEDGFSTCNGLGAGLPGVKRMMDEFLLESEPGKGTRVVVVKWRGETDGGAGA